MFSQLRSIRAIALLGGIASAAIVLSVALVLTNLRAQRIAHVQTETNNLALNMARQTELAFEGVDLMLTSVQDRLQSNYGAQFSLDSLATHLLLGARVSGSRQVDALFIADSLGNLVNSSKDPVPQGLMTLGRGYFSAFAEGQHDGLFIDKPTRSRSDGLLTMYLSRRLQDGQGKFRGVVVAAIKVKHLEQFYNFPESDIARAVSVYSLDGTLLTSVPQRESLVGAIAPELQEQIGAIPKTGLKIASHAKGDGSRQNLTLARVQQFPLLVSATHDVDEALASWRETAFTIAAAACITLIVILVAAMLLGRYLLREDALTFSLHEANTRYQDTLNAVMDAIVAVDESQNIVLFNPAAEQMFGISTQDAMGSPLSRLMGTRHHARHTVHVQQFQHGIETSRPMGPRLVIMGLHTDGHEFPIESTISRTTSAGKLQFTAVLRDITERRKAEAAVNEMNHQLRGLSASLLNVREQERTRIARELHDELGQQLTGLKLDMSWLHNRLNDGTKVTTEQLDSMRALLDGCITAVRRISTELRPIILDDLGFGEAVAWQAREIAKRSGLQISLDLQAAPLVDEERWATPLFRIVQEALTNVVRHAHATQVWISVLPEDEALVLQVQDDGVGMPVDPSSNGGFGVVSMRERATALGGTLCVAVRPEGGTMVQVHLSLDAGMLLPKVKS
jgi:PAS domain S-box-containing protein